MSPSCPVYGQLSCMRKQLPAVGGPRRRSSSLGFVDVGAADFFGLAADPGLAVVSPAADRKQRTHKVAQVLVGSNASRPAPAPTPRHVVTLQGAGKLDDLADTHFARALACRRVLDQAAIEVAPTLSKT
jgi:hypothetical protein